MRMLKSNRRPQRTKRRQHSVRRGRFRRRADRQGAYAVEMAVALPVLLSVVLGGFELMHFCGVRHAINQAAYEAARRLVIPGGTRDDAIEAADRIAVANRLELDNLVISPDVITRDTREVTVVVRMGFRNSWSFANLFGSHVVEGRCTLGHENLSIFGRE